jgi:hypothetical protein
VIAVRPSDRGINGAIPDLTVKYAIVISGHELRPAIHAQIF